MPMCYPPNGGIPYLANDCSAPPPAYTTPSIIAAPSGAPNAVYSNPSADCSNQSILGSAALGKIVCTISQPAFWKSAAIVAVAVLLIGAGLLLAVGATVGGASNKYV